MDSNFQNRLLADVVLQPLTNAGVSMNPLETVAIKSAVAGFLTGMIFPFSPVLMATGLFAALAAMILIPLDETAKPTSTRRKLAAASGIAFIAGAAAPAFAAWSANYFESLKGVETSALAIAAAVAIGAAPYVAPLGLKLYREWKGVKS
jgi:hypothetical protein